MLCKGCLLRTSSGFELVGRIAHWFLPERLPPSAAVFLILRPITLTSSFPLSPSAGVWPPLGSQASCVCPPLLPVRQAHPDGAADLKQHHCWWVGPRSSSAVTEKKKTKAGNLKKKKIPSCPPLKFPTSQLMLCLQWCSAPGGCSEGCN